jgi:hypothetical protein
MCREPEKCNIFNYLGGLRNRKIRIRRVDHVFHRGIPMDYAKLWADLRYNESAWMDRLFGSVNGSRKAVQTLAAIAINRAAFDDCVKRGDAEAASRYAQAIDIHVSSLADWAKHEARYFGALDRGDGGVDDTSS